MPVNVKTKKPAPEEAEEKVIETTAEVEAAADDSKPADAEKKTAKKASAKKAKTETADTEEVKAEATEEKVETEAEAEPEAEKKSKKATSKKDPSKEKAAEPSEKAEANDSDSADAGEEKKPKAKRSSNLLRERKRAISKDTQGDDLILEKAAFDTFSGAMASKERKKELMGDVRVITEDGDEVVETLATIRHNEYLELRGSAQASKIVSGEIIGVRYTDPENPNSMVVADVRYKTGAIKVTIPALLLFDYDQEQYQTPQGNREIFEAVKRRINSNIKFVAAYVSQDESECVGDRLRACAMNSSRFYLNNWRNTNQPRVIPGLIVKGKVMAVGKNYVIVDALGADIRIPRDELSYKFVGDARQMFNVCDEVNVQVTEINEKTVKKGRNTYKLAHVKGSIKSAYPNMRKKYYDEFPIGFNTSAVITYIDDNVRVFCELSGGKMDCICPYPSRGPAPAVGQKRVVQITGRDDNEYRLFGMFQNT